MPFFCEKRKNCIFLIQFWDALLLAVRVNKSLHKSAAFLSLQWWRLCYYWVFKVRELVSASYIRTWTSVSNLEEQTFQEKKSGKQVLCPFLNDQRSCDAVFLLFCLFILFSLLFLSYKKYSPIGLSSMHFLL